MVCRPFTYHVQVRKYRRRKTSIFLHHPVLRFFCALYCDKQILFSTARNQNEIEDKILLRCQPCLWVNIYRRFERFYYVHLQVKGVQGYPFGISGNVYYTVHHNKLCDQNLRCLNRRNTQTTKIQKTCAHRTAIYRV